MKSFRSTLILAVLAVACAAATYFLVYKKDEKDKEQKEKETVLFGWPDSDWAEFRMERKSDNIVIARENDKWYLREPLAEEADMAVTNNFVASLRMEKSREVVVEGADVKWEIFGLDHPATRLAVKNTNGETRHLAIGSIKSYDNNLYARIDQEPRVLLVSNQWDILLTKLADDFRKRSLLSVNLAKADRLQIKSSKGTRVFTKSKEGTWSLQGASTPIPIGENEIMTYLGQLRDLRALQFTLEKQKGAAQLAAFGLQAPGLDVRVNEGDKVLWTMQTGKIVPGRATNVYAMSTDLAPVVEIYKTNIENLDRKIESFYSKSQPFKFSVDEATMAEVKTPGQVFKAKKTSGIWALSEMQGATLDSEKMQQFVQRLADLEMAQYLGAEKGKGVAPPLHEVVLKNEKGALVRQVAWGETFDIKDDKGQVIAKQVYFKSNQVPALLSVPESSVLDFNLKEVFKPITAGADKSPKENK